RMKTFPPGYKSDLDDDGSELGPGWGWAAFLLDDMEQGNIPVRLDLKISDPGNAQARVSLVPSFMCPSEVTSDPFTVVDAGGQPICDVGRANYVAMNGVLGVSDDAGDNN